MAAPLLRSGNLSVRSCRYGATAYFLNDLYIGRSFETYGEYAESEMILLRQVLPKGGIALDIGANIGAHSQMLARHVGPAGRVIAFEPQRILHQLLCTNLALNGHAHVDCRRQAVGAAAGSLIVPAVDYGAPFNFGGLALATQGRGESVPVIALDSLDLPACHLVKIDVEGMEPSVLEGARSFLARHGSILYVEVDRKRNYETIMTRLLDMNYRVWVHKAPLYNKDNYFRFEPDIFNDTISLNALCIPKGIDARIPLPEVLKPTDGLAELFGPPD